MFKTAISTQQSLDPARPVTIVDISACAYGKYS